LALGAFAWNFFFGFTGPFRYCTKKMDVAEIVIKISEDLALCGAFVDSVPPNYVPEKFPSAQGIYLADSFQCTCHLGHWSHLSLIVEA
jgi:hypothetical protein